MRSAALARQAGDTAAAVQALERALQLASPPAQAFAELTKTHLDMDNTAAARQVVERGIALYPRDPALLSLAKRVQ
jgi:Tfp pilus assembly protein PilF